MDQFRCVGRAIALMLPLACGAVARGQAVEAAPGVPDASHAEAPAAAEPTPAVSAVDPQVLASLIRELDDDRFAAREAAQQRLLTLGLAALDELGRVAATGSLESSTRAVSILLDWSRSDDTALSMGALERLAALTNRPAEAAMASDRLADVRERAAMELIVELGGRVEYDRQIPVFVGTHPNLQVIIGPRWTGGVKGLVHLGSVRRLTTLSFYSSSVAGDDAARELPAFKQIQRVEFYGTPISKPAEEELKKTMPYAMVDVRGGARLGIAEGQPVPGGAQVGEVQPGTAAEKAGLMPNDVITEIEGVAVADFASLTKEIAKAKAGDTVTLKVLRQAPLGQPAMPIEVRVHFERWSDEQPVNPGAPNPLGGTPLGMPTRVIFNRR